MKNLKTVSVFRLKTFYIPSFHIISTGKVNREEKEPMKEKRREERIVLAPSSSPE